MARVCQIEKIVQFVQNFNLKRLTFRGFSVIIASDSKSRKGTEMDLAGMISFESRLKLGEAKADALLGEALKSVIDDAKKNPTAPTPVVHTVKAKPIQQAESRGRGWHRAQRLGVK